MSAKSFIQSDGGAASIIRASGFTDGTRRPLPTWEGAREDDGERRARGGAGGSLGASRRGRAARCAQSEARRRPPRVSARPVASFGGRRARGVARGAVSRVPARGGARARGRRAARGRRVHVVRNGGQTPRRAGRRLGGRRATRPRGEIRSVEVRRRFRSGGGRETTRARERRRRKRYRFRRAWIGRHRRFLSRRRERRRRSGRERVETAIDERVDFFFVANQDAKAEEDRLPPPHARADQVQPPFSEPAR